MLGNENLIKVVGHLKIYLFINISFFKKKLQIQKKNKFKILKKKLIH